MFGITADVKVHLQELIEAAEAEDKLCPQDSCGTAQTWTTPLDGSELQPNPEPPSALKESRFAQNHLSSAEPVVGYVEPIDEDISESDVWSKPEETCVDRSRMGRTRKRTLCPCCVPAALHPAVKSGLRLEELEAWALLAGQTGRKAARTKGARRHGPLQRKSTKIRAALVCPQHLWTL